MTQIEFTIERHGDSYHAIRWLGEAKFLGHGGDPTTPMKKIEGWARPNLDEGNTRIWRAAAHVFGSARSYAMCKIGANPDDRFVGDPPNKYWIGDTASVQVERYPHPEDGHDQAVVRSSLPMFADDSINSDDLKTERCFDLAARQPDAQICEALIVLTDWMIEETVRQVGDVPTG